MLDVLPLTRNWSVGTGCVENPGICPFEHQNAINELGVVPFVKATDPLLGPRPRPARPNSFRKAQPGARLCCCNHFCAFLAARVETKAPSAHKMRRIDCGYGLT